MVEFRKTIVKGSFAMSATVALPALTYVELMNLKVPAQQQLFWGNGAILGGVDDRGIFKLNVNKAGPTNLPGTARIVVSDANRVVRNFRREFRSEDLLSAGSGVRLGKDVIGAGQDSYLIVEYAADSADTATSADTTISAPITVRTL